MRRQMRRDSRSWLPHHLLLLVLVAVGSGPASFAQESCFDYTQLPHLEGRTALAGRTLGLAPYGDFVYVTAHTSGLHTVDVSDPQHPVRRATFNSPGEAHDVAVTGTLAVLADGSRGLTVLDLSRPELPTLIGQLDIAPHLKRVAIAGNLACFAASGGATGLVIVDLTNPALPTLIGSAPTTSYALDIAVIDGHAFLIDTYKRLYAFDISTPTTPALVSTFLLTHTPTSLTSYGNHLYVGSMGGGVMVVDVSVPSAPADVGSFAALRVGGTTGTSIVDVTVVGERGCFVNVDRELGIFDCADPARPRILTGIRLAGGPSAVAAGGNLLFASLDNDGVQVMEDNGFTLPVPVSALPAAADFVPGRVSLWAGHAYVASDSLRVFDLSAPGGPARVATIAVGGAADIDIQDGFAYVACATGSRLRVYDLSEPGMPVEIVDLAATPSPRRVLAVGDYLYSGPHNSTLNVLDISIPAEASYKEAQPDFVNIPNCFAVRGNRLYVGSGPYLQVLDISNPAMPVVLNTIVGYGSVRDIVLAGDRAYLASTDIGLTIVDITVPTLPALGTCALPAAGDISLAGNLAYVCDAMMGVAVVDISDETQPTLLGIKRGRATSAEIVGDHLLVSGAGYQTGLEMLPLHCDGLSPVTNPPATAARLRLQAAPDPFNPHTQFRFSLGVSGVVDLVVHDISGRRVRHLLSMDPREAGDHVITWDGRDDHGRQLASGKYFCRLSAGAEVALRSVIMLK